MRAIVNARSIFVLFKYKNFLYLKSQKGNNHMISFAPLWDTLKRENISQYKLIKEYKISTGQLDRLRKNGNVNTYTLDQLCKILNCSLDDIAIYIKDE